MTDTRTIAYSTGTGVTFPYVYRTLEQTIAHLTPSWIEEVFTRVSSLPEVLQHEIEYCMLWTGTEHLDRYYRQLTWRDDHHHTEYLTPQALAVLDEVTDAFDALTRIRDEAATQWGLHPLGFEWVENHYRHDGWTIPGLQIPGDHGTPIITEYWQHGTVEFTLHLVRNYRYSTLVTTTEPATVDQIPERIAQLRELLDPDTLQVFLALQRLHYADPGE